MVLFPNSFANKFQIGYGRLAFGQTLTDTADRAAWILSQKNPSAASKAATITPPPRHHVVIEPIIKDTSAISPPGVRKETDSPSEGRSHVGRLVRVLPKETIYSRPYTWQQLLDRRQRTHNRRHGGKDDGMSGTGMLRARRDRDPHFVCPTNMSSRGSQTNSSGGAKQDTPISCSHLPRGGMVARGMGLELDCSLLTCSMLGFPVLPRASSDPCRLGLSGKYWSHRRKRAAPSLNGSGP